MSFCMSCGAQNAPGNRFCIRCGAPILQTPPMPNQQNQFPDNGIIQQPSVPAYPAFRQTTPPQVANPPQQPYVDQVPPQQELPQPPQLHNQSPQPGQSYPVFTHNSGYEAVVDSDNINDAVNKLVRESLEANGYLLPSQPEPDALEFRRNNRPFIYKLDPGGVPFSKHFTIMKIIATFEDDKLLEMLQLVAHLNTLDFAAKLEILSEQISRKRNINFVTSSYSFPKHLITAENVNRVINEITDEMNLQIETYIQAVNSNGNIEITLID